jgi:hypothetical protein
VLTALSVIGSLKGVIDTSLDLLKGWCQVSLVVLLNLFDLIVNDQTKLNNCGVDVIIEISPPPPPCWYSDFNDARLRRLISSRHFVLRIVGVSRIYVKLLS